ncbi:hypothetical protein [Conyzicola sp.]|uniref:hypothetical protein n=1 Tax=Conyzicola sp. TaxID=1969404 RepID=UPI0039895477
MPSNPRFKPRDWAANPKHFGSSETIEWLDRPRTKSKTPPANESAPDAEKREQHELDQRGAARRQHELALVIRQTAKIRGHYTITAYAEEFGLNYKRLNTILNGTAIMRLEDVANAERNLRVTLFWSRNPNGPSAPATG